jgi:hypothetical protein
MLSQQNPRPMKRNETQSNQTNKNGEQVAVANPIGAFSSEFLPNYNLNIFVHHRSLLRVSYARTFS